MKKVEVLGIKIDAMTEPEKSQRLSELLLKSRPSFICTPNTEIIIKAQTDKELYKILNRYSSLNIPDGIGLLWAAKFHSLKMPSTPFFRELIIILQWIISIIAIPLFPNFFKNPIPQRISGSDFVWDIAKYSAENKLRVFLLGGAPTIAERAALKLQTEIYNLRISGVHSGTEKDTEEIIQAVQKSKADVILVAFGAPKQEKWLQENLKKTGCKIGMGVGGTFDFLAGTQTRAPQFIRTIGLEWLYRLVREPSRLLRQMALPKFLCVNLYQKLKQKEL